MSKRLRQVAVAASVCLTVALFGCGGSGTAASDEPAATEETATEEAAEEEAAEEPAEEEAASELGKAELKVASSDVHYELKEVGSFEADRRDVSFQYKGAIGFDGDGNPQLLGIDGKPMLDGQAIKGIESWGSGLYLVGADLDDVNNCALVSLTDGTLIEPSAATMSYSTDDPADARFIEVVYATDETDDEDECFVYATDKMFSLSVEEGDTMYKGYAKVYDLKKHAFVDGVELDNGKRTALKDLGNAFVIEGKDGTYTMYSPKGKELWSSSDYPSFGKKSIATSSSGTYQIIGGKGKALFTYDNYITPMSNTYNDLYMVSQDDKIVAIDHDGNVVLGDGHDSIIGEYGGVFAVVDDEKTTLVDSAGKVLADDVQEYTTSGLIPGYVLYKDSDDSYAICKSDGTQLKGLDGSVYDMVCYKDNDYRVLSDDSTLTLYGAEALDKALVKGHKDESASTYGVYDLFTGEALLDESYESVGWAGGYVFAFKDGSWTVYEAKRVAK